MYKQRLTVLFLLSSFVRRSGGHAISGVCWVAFRIVASHPPWVVGTGRLLFCGWCIVRMFFARFMRGPKVCQGGVWEKIHSSRGLNKFALHPVAQALWGVLLVDCNTQQAHWERGPLVCSGSVVPCLQRFVDPCSRSVDVQS